MRLVKDRVSALRESTTFHRLGLIVYGSAWKDNLETLYVSDSGCQTATWGSNIVKDADSYMGDRKFKPVGGYMDGQPRQWYSACPYDDKGARSELAFNIFTDYSKFISEKVSSDIWETMRMERIEDAMMTLVADLRVPLSPLPITEVGIVAL